MTHYGKYGNANIFYPLDWQKIDETAKDAEYSKLGDTKWDDSTSTCEVYSSVLIKVVHAGMGFRDNS